MPPGKVEIELSSNGNDYVRSGMVYAFADIFVTGANPEVGPREGGTPVYIVGEAFKKEEGVEARCRFGHVDVSASVVNSTHVLCVAPPEASAATGDDSVSIGHSAVKLVVTFDGTETFSSIKGFTYHSKIRLHRVAPSALFELSSTKIVVSGTSFVNGGGLSCRLDDGAVVQKAVWVSGNTVLCSADRATRGSHTVAVSNNGLDWSQDVLSFVVAERPGVESVRPSSSPVSGGTLVHVFGARFSDIRHLYCKFGGLKVPARLVNASCVACVSPPNNAGVVSFQVADRDLLFLSEAVNFTYAADRAGAVILPAELSTEGGTKVVISNVTSNSPEVVCSFDGKEETVAVASLLVDKEYSCTSPPLDTGYSIVRIQDRMHGFVYAQRTLSVQSVPAPFVANPTFAFSRGGKRVVVSGYDVMRRPSRGVRCSFDGTEVAAVAHGEGALSCLVPPHAPGMVNLVLKADGSSVFSGAAIAFKYIAEGRITGVYPASGTKFGGTGVTVAGNGFHKTSSSKCAFGDNLVDAVVLNSTSAYCVAPPGKVGATSRVGLSFNGAEFIYGTETNGDDIGFRYTEPVVLTMISPAVLYYGKSVVAVVVGSGFRDSPNLRCRTIVNGNMRIFQARYTSEASLSCDIHAATAPGARPGDFIGVEVSSNGAEFTNTGAGVLVKRGISISYTEPAGGPLSGGTVFSVHGRDFSQSTDYACVFGADLQSTSIFVNASLMRCVVPPGLAPGKRTFALLDVNGGARVEYRTFTYNLDIRLDDFAPKIGPATGGTAITVRGANFVMSKDFVCRFGRHVVQAVYVNSTAAICISPFHQGTSMALEISANAKDFVRSAEHFRFVSHNEILAVAPSTMLLGASGTFDVTVDSVVSAPAAWCRLYDGVEASTVYGMIVDNVTVRCPVDCKTEGGKEVLLSFNGMDFMRSATIFTCTRHEPLTAPLAESLGLTSFESYAGCVTGSGGGNESSSASPNCVQGTRALLWTPSLQDPASLWFSKGRRNSSATTVNSTVLANVELRGMAPSRGPSYGGTEVLFTGKNLLASSNARCSFGGAVVMASVLDSTRLLCRSPARAVGPVSVQVSMDGSTFTGPLFSFEYRDAPRVLSVSPSQREVSTRSVAVNVSGFAFHSGSAVKCRFNSTSTAVVNAIFLSSTLVQCASPGVSKPGVVTVEISNNGDDFSQDNVFLEYIDPPRVELLSPAIGPPMGETTISVFGSYFSQTQSYFCRFGSAASLPLTRGLWISASQIKCKTPRAPSGGTVPLFLSLNGADFFDSKLVFRFTSAPQVRYVSPSHGSVPGGETVDIFGKGFVLTKQMACRFGDKSVPASFITGAHIRCRTPRSRPGRLDLTVTTDGKTFSADHVPFTFIEVPQVLTMSPNAINVGALSKLSLVGVNFEKTHTYYCRLDGQTVQAKHELGSGGKVTCEFTTEITTASNLSISVNGALFTETGFEVRKLGQSRVTSILPRRGPYEGNTNVTLIGTNFVNSAGLGCKFGAVASSFAMWKSPTEIVCRSPAHMPTPGAEVSVSNNGHDFFPTGLSFAFVGNAQVESVNPTAGSVSGGTLVVVQGKNFALTDALRCRFGATAVTAVFISSTEIRCISPQRAQSAMVGSVSFSVTNNGQDHSSSNVTFTYSKQAVASVVYPAFGPVDGGYDITVSGASFVSGSTFCRFQQEQGQGDGQGHLPATSVVVSATVLGGGASASCTVPAGRYGMASLEVSTNSVDFSPPLKFTYVRREVVTGLSSSSGTELGGTTVVVHGSNFLDRASLSCRFGDMVVPGRWISDESIRCSSPSRSPGVVLIGVANNGVHFQSSDIQFVYHQGVSVVSLSPSEGPASGMTTLAVTGRNFVNGRDIVCVIDGIRVEARHVNNTLVECVTPSHAPGEVMVSVANNRYDVIAGGSLPFTYRPVMVAEEVSPHFVSAAGGAMLSVLGSGFARDAQMRCRFGGKVEDGGKVALATVLSTTRLTCIAPALNLGAHAIEISSNGEDFVAVPLPLHVDMLPIVSSIYPTNIPEKKAGIVVDVKGAEFVDHAASSCRVVPAATSGRGGDGTLGPFSLRFLSSTLVQCTLPALHPGRYYLHVSCNGLEFTRDVVLEVYSPIHVADSFQPTFGPRKGGTSVAIMAPLTDFPEALGSIRCRFNTTFVYARRIGGGKLVCVAPRSEHAGVVTFDVFTLDDQPLSLPGKHTYEYVSSPDFDNVFPLRGQVSGGTVVSIHGSGFRSSAGSKCKFGSTAVSMVFYNSTHVSCMSPPAQVPSSAGPDGGVELHLSFNGYDYESTNMRFRYVKALTLRHISPAEGPERGGTFVKIFGQNFDSSGELFCDFEGAVAAALWISSTEVHCKTPKHQPGVVQIALFSDVLPVISASKASFTYLAEPMIDSLVPSSGADRGGNVVSLFGTNFFVSSRLLCKFGDVTALASFVSPTELRCMAPPQAARVVALQVSVNGQDFSAVGPAAKSYRYYPAAVVNDVYPTTIPVGLDSTSIYLRGEGFDAARTYKCRFKTAAAAATIVSTETATFVSPTLLKCPARSNIGRTGILVYLCESSLSEPALPSAPSGGAPCSASMEFAATGYAVDFTSLPILKGVTPVLGSSLGGTDIKLFGVNVFRASGLRCSFNGTAFSPVKWVSDKEVICTTPAFAPGRVRIALNFENTTVSNEVSYTFIEAPEVFSLSPSTPFSTRGGSDVLVFGQHFSKTSALLCRIGTNVAPATFVNASLVICRTQADEAGAHAVAITTNGHDYSTQDVMLTLAVDPIVEAVSPDLGSVAGGTVVSVSGKNFHSGVDLRCTFGDDDVGTQSRVPGEYVSEVLLRCVAPAASRSGGVGVTVCFDCAARGPRIVSSAAPVFMYHQPVSVLSVSPLVGSRLGGTRVRIKLTNVVHSKSVKCVFGDNALSGAVQARYIAANQVECITAEHDVGKFSLAISLNDGADLISASPFEFAFIEPLGVVSLSPQRGTVRGGGELRVHITPVPGLLEAFCRIGNEVVKAMSVVDGSLIFCNLPAHVAGTVGVEVSRHGQDYSRSGLTYEYVDHLAFASVEPSSGTAAGGTLVTLSLPVSQASLLTGGIGDDAMTEVTCDFDGAVVVGDATSNPGKVKCVAPARHLARLSGADATVRVSAVDAFGSVDISDSGVAFTYKADISVSSAWPVKAPCRGGDEVRVTGKNFFPSPELKCSFGGVLQPAVWMSSTLISCKTPRHVPANVMITVSGNGGVDVALSSLAFEFYPSPAVLSIGPVRGWNYGGTMLTVTGNHFFSSPGLACIFDGHRRVPATFVSTTSVRCATPPRPGFAGLSRVEVSLDNVTATSNLVAFAYDEPVKLSHISPERGPSTGGTAVHVFGSGFKDRRNLLRCKFGGRANAVVVAAFISRDEIRCMSPASAKPARESIEITLNGVDYLPISGAFFEYELAPEVASTWPFGGPAFDGNTLVTVHGQNFRESAELGCRFGSVFVVAHFVSSTTILCRSPPSTPGLRTFQVTNNGVDFFGSRFYFQYFSTPSVSQLVPNEGLAVGQIPVFVRGKHFLNTSSLTCRFGNSRLSRAVYISSTLLSCIAPSRLAIGRNVTGVVAVDVSNNGNDFTHSGVLFTYRDDCPSQKYCPQLNMMNCPNGTSCENIRGNFNFTLCEPGHFQPAGHQRRCLVCPVGYYCPDFGMAKPLLCPAGFVCDTHALKVPLKRCPKGHYCLQGTKTDDTRDFVGIVDREWVREPHTGVVSFRSASRTWAYTARAAPATGQSRPEHPPVANPLLAERPYPCPLGTYCLAGTATSVSIVKNYSTPQPCTPGFFW